jgi:hypothetical protein
MPLSRFDGIMEALYIRNREYIDGKTSIPHDPLAAEVRDFLMDMYNILYNLYDDWDAEETYMGNPRNDVPHDFKLKLDADARELLGISPRKWNEDKDDWVEEK